MLRRSVFHICQWVSIRPGSTIMPVPLISTAPGALSFGPIATITPSRTCTSAPAMSPVSRSMVMIWALRMTKCSRAGRRRADAAIDCPAAASTANEAVPHKIPRRLKRRAIMGGLPDGRIVHHRSPNGKPVVRVGWLPNPQACAVKNGRDYPLLNDHLDHVVAQRRVEALRHLIGGRDLHTDLELRAVGGDAVDVGVGGNAKPNIRPRRGLHQEPAALLLQPCNGAGHLLLDDRGHERAHALELAIERLGEPLEMVLTVPALVFVHVELFDDSLEGHALRHHGADLLAREQEIIRERMQVLHVAEWTVGGDHHLGLERAQHVEL